MQNRLTDNEDYCLKMCGERKGDEIREKCPLFNICSDKDVWNKLRDYENLEETGYLARFPVKVGDILYEVIDELNDDTNTVAHIIKKTEPVADVAYINNTFYVAYEKPDIDSYETYYYCQYGGPRAIPTYEEATKMVLEHSKICENCPQKYEGCDDCLITIDSHDEIEIGF